MKFSSKKKSLKVIEFVVVGMATWLIALPTNPLPKIPDFSNQQASPTACSDAKSRGSQPTTPHPQLLLFLLKLCFRILAILQPEPENPKQTPNPHRDRALNL